MAGNAGKRKQDEKSQKVLDIFAKVLMGFAIISAFAAVVFAFLWFVTSWYAPYENYKELQEIVTVDGQYLKIEYPKRILANHKPTYFILTLNGHIDKAKSLDITFPSEIRISDFKEDASRRRSTQEFSDLKSSSQFLKLTLFHSKTVQGIGWYSTKTVSINSPDFLTKPIDIKIQMENVGWATIREFVNSSVGDKSPLILLASGLISGAGTYLLQFIKDKREQQKEKEQQEREGKELAKKNNDELWKGLKSDPVQTIKNFADQLKDESSTSPIKEVVDKFQNEFRVLKLNDWQNLLFRQILINWHKEDTKGVSELLEVSIFIEVSFLGKAQENTEVLLQINKLMSTEKTDLQLQDAETILSAYKYWRNPCKSILQKVLLKYIQIPGNLRVIAKSFREKTDLGYPILRASDINTLLRQYDISQLTKEQKEALTDLNWLLWSGIYWDPLWQNTLRLPSRKIYRWLKYNDASTKHIPFGSEFAELDVDLDYYKIEHPIISQVGYPMSTIIFGEIGAGKTATAYLLVKNCQISNLAMIGSEPGAFPIYCRFDDSNDARTWLIETVSQALIDFVSANTDRFLVASPSHRLAMGRLMLTKATTVNQLRNSLCRAGLVTSEDIEEILIQLSSIEIPKFGEKIRDIDVINLFRTAIPDGFNRVYFLMDISNRSSLKQAAIAIMSLSELSLQLAKQNFFFKIFAPLEIKPELGNTTMFEQLELNWHESQLQVLLERRFDRFKGLCDRKVKQPSETLIRASRKSPRRLIHYGNSLMQYADANLLESEKLPIEAFSEILDASSGDRKL